MTDKIEKMTDDDFKKIMQQLGMPENMSLYSALKQVENHTWQAARTVPEGVVMVPVELLQLIQCDVENSADWLSGATSALRNLLSAAQEPKK